MPKVYSPAEDSDLISGVIKKEISKLKNKSKINFLEIGSGSGINLETAKSSGIKKENIFSVDINSKAVKKCKDLGFNCLKSDLFEKVKGKYDLIVFNPPYLPEDKTNFESEESKLITTGGKKGDEIILRFLGQAKNFLSPSGKIFLLTSSLTPKINFIKLGYKSKILKKKNLFFEKLFVHELKT